MRGAFAVALAAGIVLAGSGADLAAASPARTTCPQLTDARGDVAPPDEDPVMAAAGPWDERSLDVLSATVSADAKFVTTYVRVAGLAGAADPAHSFLWSVRLQPQTPREGEYLWTHAWRLAGGDRFAVERDYTSPGGFTVGPLTHINSQVDEVDTTGSVDARHGLISVQIPLSLLATWDIPKTAPVWDIHAATTRVIGAAAGDVSTRPMMYESKPADETRPTRYAGRLDQPGCSPPRG
jgi:hypothetical protein